MSEICIPYHAKHCVYIAKYVFWICLVERRYVTREEIWIKMFSQIVIANYESDIMQCNILILFHTLFFVSHVNGVLEEFYHVWPFVSYTYSLRGTLAITIVIKSTTYIIYYQYTKSSCKLILASNLHWMHFLFSASMFSYLVHVEICLFFN